MWACRKPKWLAWWPPSIRYATTPETSESWPRIVGELPIADDFTADDCGLRPIWSSTRSWEQDYIGALVRWSEIRDADPAAAPPEIRTTDGRTLFVTALRRDELQAALAARAVPEVKRPPVWNLILDEFLDTDYEIFRESTERRLVDIGVSRAEFTRIRALVRMRMNEFVAATWEWADLSHADLIAAHRFSTAADYRRFRAWTDRIADSAS